MKTAMQIRLTTAHFDDAPDDERATFGRLEIEAEGQLLTTLIRNRDNETEKGRGPNVSGYCLAEWLVWNWWRLRWEPRPPKHNASFHWNMTHCMTAAGEGYRWPNITISSDGFRCILNAKPTDESDTPFLYYLGAPGGRPIGVPAIDFEVAVDQFVATMLQLLKKAGRNGTNLATLWDDLNEERQDPELARFRHIEALLGFDPDEVDEQVIYSSLEEAKILGENALKELATGTATSMMSAQQIDDATKSVGFSVNTHDAFRFQQTKPIQWGESPAWRAGVTIANAVRQQAGLSEQPVTNTRLAQLAGVCKGAIESDQRTGNLSWIFRTARDSPRIALRSSWQTGRRFDVARLFGDLLFSQTAFTHVEPLCPATRSYSYRQKAQRAFAAELLSPWQMVRTMLNGDYSEENQDYVAEHFNVSPRTIDTLLKNNEGYNRDLEEELTLA